jgi:voltage-gated potassium channel Kch
MVDLALRIFSIAAGSVLVFLVVADVFQSVILPRSPTFRFRLSALILRPAWKYARRYALHNISGTERREDFIATVAPLMLVVFIGFWMSALIVAFGAIFYGLREYVHVVNSFGDALYFAGTSILTIGYGDLVPTGGATRFIAIAAGMSGLGVFAVTTAYLFALFGSFQSREVFVVILGSRAGAPPSGVMLLENYGRLGIHDEVCTVFESAMHWAATLLESHLAYPILAYFRSSHEGESWISTLGAMLDAAALAKTVIVDERLAAHATFFLDMGGHAVGDLSRYFQLDIPGEAGIEREEFDTAVTRLRAAGFQVRDAADCWAEFGRIRSRYAASLQAMAGHWIIPPAEWIGDRSAVSHGHG